MKKKRLLIYFCISLALFILIGVSFFYLRKLNALEKNNERVDRSYEVIIQTNQLEKNLLNAETRQRGFLLTQDPAYLEAYLAEIRVIPDIFVKLDILTSDNYPQQKNLDTLREVINLQLGFLKDNLEMKPNDTLAISQFMESDVYMNKIRSVIRSIRSHEDYLLNVRHIDKQMNTKNSRQSSFLSLVTAFALVLIAAVTILWFFNRNEVYRAELEDKLLKLTSLNNEIKELTIASTHNLQEPMRKIQMTIDRLQHRSNVSDEELNTELSRIKDIYSRQQLTNNTIVDYYTILTAVEKKERIHLNAFIEALKVKNRWEEHFALTVEPLQDIYADAVHLELLFRHIIDNSIRFRQPGRPLEIRIHAVTEKINVPELKSRPFYTLAVSDNGSGIAPEYLPRMFGLFQKIESSGDARQAGMGLSFCRRIMLNHGGWITARQNTPNGVSILLFFPKEGKV